MIITDSKDIRKNRVANVQQAAIDLRVVTGRIVVPHKDRKEYREKAGAGKETYTRDLWGAIQRAAGGKITDAQFRKEVATLMDARFRNCWELGRKTVGLTDPLGKLEMAAYQGAVREEIKFAQGFMRDVRNGTGKMPYMKRLDMYGDTLDGMYDLSVAASLPSDVKIYWILGIAEHCADCLALESGNPYSKFGIGANPLPAVPRSGYTQCLSHCKCRLEMIVPDGRDLSPEPQLGMDAYIDGTYWEKLPEPDRTAIGEELKDVDALFRRQAYYRQMMEAVKDDEMRKRYIALRRETNDAIIQIQDRMGASFMPRASVAEIIEPVRAAQRADLALATWNPKIVEVGDTVRVLDGLRSYFGETVAVSTSQYVLQYRGVTGLVRSVRLNDDDFTLVWKEPKQETTQ